MIKTILLGGILGFIIKTPLSLNLGVQISMVSLDGGTIG